MIKLDHVSKTYRNGDLAVEVLHGVSLAIHPGEFVAIMGASGSGKSTLMNIIGCLDRPTTGQYRFMGEDVAGFGRDELARLRREAFGFIFQSFNLIPVLTVFQNVEFPLLIQSGHKAADRAKKVEALLAEVGLTEQRDQRSNELSGGQRQRVAIARALANRPLLLLADEPTGNLDPKTSEQVHGEFLRLIASEGLAALVATHNIALARKMSRIVHLDGGKLIQASSVDAALPGVA